MKKDNTTRRFRISSTLAATVAMFGCAPSGLTLDVIDPTRSPSPSETGQSVRSKTETPDPSKGADASGDNGASASGGGTSPSPSPDTSSDSSPSPSPTPSPTPTPTPTPSPTPTPAYYALSDGLTHVIDDVQLFRYYSHIESFSFFAGLTSVNGTVYVDVGAQLR